MMNARWRACLFGSFHLEGQDQVIHRFRTQKTGALLAYLAYFRGRAHPRETLIDLFWPDADPDAGRDSLSTALSWLRRQLEADGPVIQADRTSVALDPTALTTDVAEFESAIEVARSADGTARAQWLARAVSLYTGELLTAYYEEWISSEQERLLQLYLQALRGLIQRCEETGDLAGALQYARREVGVDPLREDARRELMRLCAASGHPAEALRQYDELARMLRQELDVEPDAATQALADQVRQQLWRRGPASESRRPDSEPLSPGLSEYSQQPLLTSPQGENRVLTVLMVGLRGPDTEGTSQQIASALPRLAEIVREYGGLVESAQGEGIRAVFGAPQAHEDDPERAVRAALAMREAAPGLKMRAGLNTGEAYVEPREPEAGAVQVMGTVARLAGQLQGQAGPGQILIGKATQRFTRLAFEFAPRAVSVPGQSKPVTAYSVERTLQHPQKAHGLEGYRAALTGRDRELAALKSAYDSMLGGQGQAVCLIGEAGVGKSRLVAELKQIAGEGQWLEGRCVEMSADAGFGLFADLLRGYFAARSSAGARVEGPHVVAALREMQERDEMSEAQVEQIGPLLGYLLSVRFGTDWDLQIKNAAPEQLRHQTLGAIREFFGALARGGPVTLVFEDLHWADSLSLDGVACLMESIGWGWESGGGFNAAPSLCDSFLPPPLLLLCVYRPEQQHRCWQLSALAQERCPEAFTELWLRELTPSQSRQMVASLLRSESLPASVSELVLKKGRGNPFFMEEVVWSLLESGLLVQEGEGWTAREWLEQAPMPESAQGLIQSRLDRLSQEARLALEVASAMGRLFRRRLLELIAAGGERGREPLALALNLLEQRGWIYQERAVPEVEYSFKHVLTQEAVYRGLPHSRQRDLHHQVAEAIEGEYRTSLEEWYEPLAYHYEISGPDEKAIEYLLKAGEKSRRAYLNEAAIRYFERALERLQGDEPDSPMRSAWWRDAHKGLRLTLFRTGKPAEAEAQLRHAVRVGRESGMDAEPLVHLLYWIWETLHWQGQMGRGVEIAQEGLEMLGEGAESVGAALMYYMLAYLTGQGWDRTAALLERVPYAEELSVIYLMLGFNAIWGKRVEEGLRWARLLEEKAAQHHDLRGLARAHWVQGSGLLFYSGDPREAALLVEKAYYEFAEVGDPAALTQIGPGVFEAHMCVGDLARVAAFVRRRMTFLERNVGKLRGCEPAELLFCRTMLALVSACQGDSAEAAEQLEQALQMFHQQGGTDRRPGLILARLLYAQGRGPEALSLLQRIAGQATHLDPDLLSALEEVFGNGQAFEAFCRGFETEYPTGESSFQAHLEPAKAGAFSHLRIEDRFQDALSSGWTWHDSFGDCTCFVHDGLELRAANMRDLWRANLSAPRLLRPVSGDFAAQTACAPIPDLPALGGLLLWKDSQNYLRLGRSAGGKHEVSFQGCIRNEDRVFGRGRLPAERLFLRLERTGNRVQALCSANGSDWFTVGAVEFAIEDPAQVGLYAIGAIDRIVHLGAYPDGAAIRFESFQLFA